MRLPGIEPGLEDSESSVITITRLLQNAPECSRMLQNAPEGSRRLQKAPECSRMFQNAPEGSRMLQNASECFRMLLNPAPLPRIEASRMVQNDPGCSNAPDWSTGVGIQCHANDQGGSESNVDHAGCCDLFLSVNAPHEGRNLPRTVAESV